MGCLHGSLRKRGKGIHKYAHNRFSDYKNTYSGVPGRGVSSVFLFLFLEVC